MKFDLQFSRIPKPQPPVAEETIDVASPAAAKAEATRRLKELALKIAPPPDFVTIVNAETHELIGSIERTP